MFSFVGDTVLDPFSGTGTTMLAARKTDRNSIGVEIDPSITNAGSDLKKKLIRRSEPFDLNSLNSIWTHDVWSKVD
jgi:DNA modification methylase